MFINIFSVSVQTMFTNAIVSERPNHRSNFFKMSPLLPSTSSPNVFLTLFTPNRDVLKMTLVVGFVLFVTLKIQNFAPMCSLPWSHKVMQDHIRMESKQNIT